MAGNLTQEGTDSGVIRFEAHKEGQILLANSDPRYSEYLQLSFKMSNSPYGVTVAKNGEDLLEKAKDSSIQYDLIIFDDDLPDYTYSDMCKQLRKIPTLTYSTVAVLSNNPNPRVVADILDSGANEVLVKPMARVEFLARVRSFIKTKAKIASKIANEKQDIVNHLTEHHQEQLAAADSVRRQTVIRELIYSFTNGKFILMDQKDFDLFMTQFEEAVGGAKGFAINNVGAISRARRMVAKDLEPLEFDEDVYDDVLLAVSEVATNAVKHGGGGVMKYGFLINPEDHKKDSIGIFIGDHGPGINENFIASALFYNGASSKKSLGFGFSIIIQIVDSMCLTTSSSGTGIFMRIQRQADTVQTNMSEVLERF